MRLQKPPDLDEKGKPVILSKPPDLGVDGNPLITDEEEDPVEAAKQLLAKPSPAFLNSVQKADIKPIARDEASGDILEPTTFWGGFHKSLKDQFLPTQADAIAIGSMRGESPIETLGNIGSYFIPNTIGMGSKLLKSKPKAAEKVIDTKKNTELPKVTQETKVNTKATNVKDFIKNNPDAKMSDIEKFVQSVDNTLDDSGRVIAPAQDVVQNTRPNGPWDKNIPLDEPTALGKVTEDTIFNNAAKKHGMGLPLPTKSKLDIRLSTDGKRYLKNINKEAVDEIYNAGYELSNDGEIIKVGVKDQLPIEGMNLTDTGKDILGKTKKGKLEINPVVDETVENVKPLTAPIDNVAPSFGSRKESLPVTAPKNVDVKTGELVDDVIHPLEKGDDTIVDLAAGADLTKFDKILNFGGTMKSLMSGPDLSGLRQGFPLIGTPEYWKSIKPMVQAARSESTFNQIQNAIKTRPNAQPSVFVNGKMESKYKVGGLKLTDLGERLSGREEEIMSHAPEDLRKAFAGSNNPIAKGIRGIGHVYRGSNRGFTTYMNNLRATRFDKLIDLAAKAGHDVNDPQFLKQIGTYINNATGRGSLGDFEGAAKLLNTVAFSPRLMQSRLHFINPMNYAQQNPVARKEMWKSLAAMSGFLVTTGELAHLAGAKFELDPRNADFGKIRIGDTRIDLGGGFLPYIRLLSQLATQSKVNSETGKVTKFDKSKYDNASTMDTLGTFARTKESPLLSLVHDWASGEDFKGDPFQYDEGIAKRTSPMILQDILEVSKHNPELLPITIPASVFGAGVQSYDSNRKRKKQ